VWLAGGFGARGGIIIRACCGRNSHCSSASRFGCCRLLTEFWMVSWQGDGMSSDSRSLFAGGLGAGGGSFEMMHCGVQCRA